MPGHPHIEELSLNNQSEHLLSKDYAIPSHRIIKQLREEISTALSIHSHEEVVDSNEVSYQSPFLSFSQLLLLSLVL